MITLNTEKGLITISSWDDIISRPGFVKDLDLKDEILDSVIGTYKFAEKVKCGIKSCHTPHENGYIVTTKNGHETNIGKDCGSKYFGIDFKQMSIKLDNDIEAMEHRSCLSRFTLKIDDINTEIENLQFQKYGANWIHRNLYNLLSKNQHIPEKIVRQINLVVKQRNSIITKQREASDSEIRSLEVQLDRKINKPYYIDEEFHKLNNIEVLYPENDLREILILNIKSQIPAFNQLDIDNLNFKDLRRWAKWVNGIDLQ